MEEGRLHVDVCAREVCTRRVEDMEEGRVHPIPRSPTTLQGPRAVDLPMPYTSPGGTVQFGYHFPADPTALQMSEYNMVPGNYY